MLGFRSFSLALGLGMAWGLLASAQETPAQAPETAHSSTLKIESESLSYKRPMKREWNFGLGGSAYTEGRDEGAAAAFEADLIYERRLSEMVYVSLNPHIDLYSGRLQERYDNDSYENRIGLNGGYVGFAPVPHAELRAGAISQSYMDTWLLISSGRAFPGLQEILSSETKPVNFRFMAQQTIPTSNTLNTERTEKEQLPTFSTEALMVDGEHGVFKWKAMAGHFAWSRLPDKVAYQSGRAGNSVTGGEVLPGSRLQYGYEGYFWEAGGCLCLLGPVQFEAVYGGLKNNLAPSSVGDAQMMAAGPKFIFGDTTLRILAGTFFVERDATVARYTSGRFGHTNRMGEALDVDLEFKKLGFKVKGRWANARTVVDIPEQQTITTFSLGVETEYAPF